MPILDRLVDAGVDALQSIDPIAGVDIAEVKRRVGDKVLPHRQCEPGQAARGHAGGDCRERAVLPGACLAGGGYIYGSCNRSFPCVPLDNYLYMLDIWREYGPSPLGN